MRLRQYITEENPYEWREWIKLIKKDCGPILNFYKKSKSPIYRGLYYESREFVKKSVRKDRRPRVINKELHKLLDKFFLKHWGFKARSQGLFCGSFDTAFSWSNTGDEPHIVFPIGKFSYIYTVNPDLGFWKILTEFKDLDLDNMLDPTSIIEYIENSVEEDYSNRGLEYILKDYRDFEVIINCKEYYAVQDNDNTILNRVLTDVARL